MSSPVQLAFFRPNLLCNDDSFGGQPAALIAYLVLSGRNEHDREQLIRLLYGTFSDTHQDSLRKYALPIAKKQTAAHIYGDEDKKTVICDIDVFETDVARLDAIVATCDTLRDSVATPQDFQALLNIIDDYETDFLADLETDKLSQWMENWIIRQRREYADKYLNVLEIAIRQCILYRQNRRAFQLIEAMKACSRCQVNNEALTIAFLYETWLHAWERNYQQALSACDELQYRVERYGQEMTAHLLEKNDFEMWRATIRTESSLALTHIDLTIYQTEALIKPLVPETNPQYYDLISDVAVHLVCSESQIILQGEIGSEIEIIQRLVGQTLLEGQWVEQIVMIQWHPGQTLKQILDNVAEVIHQYDWKYDSLTRQQTRVHDYFQTHLTLLIVNGFQAINREEVSLPVYLKDLNQPGYTLFCLNHNVSGTLQTFVIPRLERQQLEKMVYTFLVPRPDADTRQQWENLSNDQWDTLQRLSHGLGMPIRLLLQQPAIRAIWPRDILAAYQENYERETTGHPRPEIMSAFHVFWDRTLPRLHRLLLMLLYIEPGTSLPLEIIDNLYTDYATDELVQQLQSLCRMNLCVTDDSGYQFNPVLRDFFQEFVNRKAPHLKLAQDKQLAKSIVQICEHIPSDMQSPAVLRTLLKGLQSGLHHNIDGVLTALETMASVYIQRGYYAELLSLLQQAVDDTSPDILTHPVSVKLHRHIATIYEKTGQSQKAIQHLNGLYSATQASESIQLPVAIQLGIFHIKADQYTQAASYLTDALDHARQTNETRYILSSLANLGSCLYNQEKLTDAQHIFEECETLAVQQKSHRYHLFALNGQAAVALDQGRYQRAKILLLRVEKLLDPSREPLQLVMPWINLSLACHFLSDWSPAQTYARKAMHIAHEADHREYTGRARWMQGIVMSATGNTLQAENFLRQALFIARDSSMIKMQAGILIELGKLYLMINRPDLAERDFRTALQASLYIPSRRYLARALYGLCLLQMNNYHAAGVEDVTETIHILRIYFRHHLPVQLADSAIVLSTDDLEAAETYLQHAMANIPHIAAYQIIPALRQIPLLTVT